MLNCPICLEADDEILTFAALKCGHVFHRDCIASWLAISKNTKICPVCRKFADSFLNLYFFSTSAKTNEHSISNKPKKKKRLLKRSNKKFSTRRQLIRQYELRSASYVSRANSPYWFRARR